MSEYDAPPDDQSEAHAHGEHAHEEHAHGDAIGSAAEEAAKLFGVLGEWARSMRADVDQHVDTGAPECAYCPICRTVHVLREAGPDVRVHLSSAAASLLQAAAAIMSSVANSGAPHRTATVERIDLDAEDDSWEDPT